MDTLRPLHRSLQMRNLITLRPGVHDQQQNLHSRRLPGGLRRYCHGHSQHVRCHLSMLTRCLRVEQDDPEREMHRRSGLGSIHGDSKRGYGSGYANNAIASVVEIESFSFRKDCIDCDLVARNHVSHIPKIDPTRHPAEKWLTIKQWIRRKLRPFKHLLPDKHIDLLKQ